MREYKGPLVVLLGLGILGYGVYAMNAGKLKPGSGTSYGSGATERGGNIHFGSGKYGGSRTEEYYDSQGRLRQKRTDYYTK